MSIALILAVAAALEVSSELGIGADYSSQSYTVYDYSSPDSVNIEVLEADTTDAETEAGGFLRLGLADAKTGLSATNTLKATTRSLREQLAAEFTARLSPRFQVRAANDAELRYYHQLLPELADTSLDKDYLDNTSRVECRLEPTENFYFRVSDVAELFRYSEPDSFSYDYFVNRVLGSGFLELGPGATVELEYGWARRWAGAQPDRDYNEHGFRAGIGQYFESGFRFDATNDLVRREYRSASYSYLDESFSIAAGWGRGGWNVEAEETGRWVFYDSTTEVYANLFENGVQLTAEFRPWDAVAGVSSLSLKLGPRYDFGSGLRGPSDEDYREISVSATIDLFTLNRLWVSVEDRFGQRRYPNADTAYQSNYTFNELSAFLNWTLIPAEAGGLRLECSANIAPEWHARETDDFGFGVYSVELKYGL